MSKKGKKNKVPEPGLPEAFVRYHRTNGFPEKLKGYECVVDEAPSVSVRTHPEKFPGTPKGESIPWCDSAYFLPEHPRFDRDPFFHAGAYYVQEASSTAIGSIAKGLSTEAEAPLKVLDLCAAPGGKSTHLASVLPKGSLLVANEAIGKRVPLLKDQIRKWGLPNVLVTHADPDRYGHQLPESFDLVLVDAPCSGEGLFRKMPEQRSEWNPGMVEHCAMRQKRIVNEAWQTLKEEGTLIYCTCTLNRKENEEVLCDLIKSREASPLNAWGTELSSWERNEIEGVRTYRSWPQDTGGEGFSLAILRKERGDDAGMGPLELSPSKKIGNKEMELPKSLRSLLKEPERWYVEEREEQLHLMEKELEASCRQLEERVPVKWKGTWTATQKGNELIPSPDLALSTLLNTTAYPMFELDGKDALRFIAREKLDPALFPKGWCGVRYDGVPLGWVKNLGDRVNGYFPKRWRLMGYEGEEVVDLRDKKS